MLKDKDTLPAIILALIVDNKREMNQRLLLNTLIRFDREAIDIACGYLLEKKLVDLECESKTKDFIYRLTF